MAIVETELEGQRVYIDTETGGFAQPPVNTYGGSVEYKPRQYEGLEGAVNTVNEASTVAGYPVSAYQQRLDPNNPRQVQVLNPASGVFERGYKMPFEMGGQLSFLPESLGKEMGGVLADRNGMMSEGDANPDFFEKMFPMAAAALVTYLTGGAGAGVATNSLFGSGALAGAGSGALAAAVTGQNPVYGAALGAMKGALPSMGGAGGVGDSVSGSSVYDPTMSGDLLNQTPSSLPTFSGEGEIPNIPSTSGGLGDSVSGSSVYDPMSDYSINQTPSSLPTFSGEGGLTPGDVPFPDPTINTATPSLAQYILNSGAPLPEGLKTALQTGGSLLPFANDIRKIVGIGSSLLGGSGEATTSGATRSLGGLPGQTNIIAPSNAMLNFAPAPKSGSFVNKQSDNTSTLFSGLTPEQSRIQVPNAPMSNAAPLQMAEFEDYAPIYSAHGGLMHFKIGGDVPDEAAETPATEYVGSVKETADINKRIAKILDQKGAKATSSDDQIREYLRRSQDSNARLDFLSPLASRMMRGRPSRPEAMYSGLQQPSVTGAAPAMGYSARPVQPMQQSPSIVNMARIPFAAHGGEIHPHLASVLADRNFEINKEMIPGPEGRYYARHEQRGFAVGGPGTGQSDDIPTMLSDGEYVIDADTVAALGDGSSKAGASVLDKFRQQIRHHKRSAPTNDIPPKAKSPMEYMKMARKGK